MGSNSFGKVFTITTWGESHGKAIGVVIDGCPANLPLSDEEINQELKLRQPGTSPYTSPREESDVAEILSGVFEGKTTGAPICIIIPNKDADSSKYEPIKDLLRPGHANFTYLEKYGIFDFRGGGRSSARETACRVAAGAVAKKILSLAGVEVCAYVKEIGGTSMEMAELSTLSKLKELTLQSPLFCPDGRATKSMIKLLDAAKAEGDSLGGLIECIAMPLPIGLGDPVYEKLEANLAKALLSIPATKGFEFGSGFASTHMKGSEHNDEFTVDEKGAIITKTNYAGGALGGISTGMPLIFRVAFKPTSSIKKPQCTLSTAKQQETFMLPERSRHDPCVTIRAVPVVEAMTALVLADAFLMNRMSKL